MTIDDVTALVEHVAATVVRPRFRHLAAADVAEKSPGDPVTVVDHAAELALTAGLRDLAPGALVVGEEAVAANPKLLDALAEAEVAYLVDPIDGTQAFVDGVGEYAVMVARVEHGEAVASWICLPEEERTFVAERGAGAWVGGTRLTRSEAPTTLAGLTGGIARFYLTQEQRAAVDAAQGFGAVRRGERLWSGYYYTRIAVGEFDFLVYWRTQPWDHAPGAVLVRELGGVSRTLDGRDWHVGSRGTLLAAADPAAWALIAEALPPELG